MSKSVKRCRQLTLFDIFESSKREKRCTPGSMEGSEKLERRELLASAAEKRINPAPCGSNSKNSQEIDQDDQFDDETQLLLSGNSQSSNSEPANSQESNSQPSNSQSSDLFENSQSTYSQSGNSQELFSELDSFHDCMNLAEEDSESSFSAEEKDVGLNRWPSCSTTTLPPLEFSDTHTILFRPHLRDGCAPRPYPDEYRDRWDGDHVRMPCSPLNRYPVEFPDGEKIIQSRWELICESLGQPITSSVDLENAIMKYNSQYLKRWNFSGLHSFLNKSLKSTQKAFFFDTILPGMVKLALKLPEICTQPIPLLKKRKDHTITMSQKQISCLLANAFFCTFPRRNYPSKWRGAAKQNVEYATYPDINFNRLFTGSKDGISPRNAEKLKCLLNYFLRVTTKEPTGTVSFRRKYRQVFPNWAISEKRLEKAVVLFDGLIEKEGHGMLQVDFADSYVGGGVLSYGCIQEEIRFIICPELIISRLFTEQLTDLEALVITGAEQYNKYYGYSDSFTWDGDYEDQLARDAWGRKYTQIVAIDALPFRNSNDQFQLSLLKRELNKAYVGFCEDASSADLPAVATGNWGCGAFKGNPELKFLIQLMAASEAGRGMLYFTFHDKKLRCILHNMYKFIMAKNLTVGLLWALFYDYCTDVMKCNEKFRPKLYEYIYRMYIDSDENKKSKAVESTEVLQTNGPVEDVDQAYNCDTTEEES